MWYASHTRGHKIKFVCDMNLNLGDGAEKARRINYWMFPMDGSAYDRNGCSCRPSILLLLCFQPIKRPRGEPKYDTGALSYCRGGFGLEIIGEADMIYIYSVKLKRCNAPPRPKATHGSYH